MGEAKSPAPLIDGTSSLGSGTPMRQRYRPGTAAAASGGGVDLEDGGVRAGLVAGGDGFLDDEEDNVRIIFDTVSFLLTVVLEKAFVVSTVALRGTSDTKYLSIDSRSCRGCLIFHGES